MDLNLKKTVEALVFVVLFLLLFVILMPPLLRVMDQGWGKILYGALLITAVGLALRLRALAKHL